MIVVYDHWTKERCHDVLYVVKYERHTVHIVGFGPNYTEIGTKGASKSKASYDFSCSAEWKNINYAIR